MAIGLKGSWKERKGCRLIYKLKELRWDIKYAWQRAWRGYDDRDVFALSGMFVEKYKAILNDYRKNRYGLFKVPEECMDDYNKLFFNEEETDMILDTILFRLEMTDEDYVEKKLYGKNVYDDDYDFNAISIDKCKYIFEVMDQNKNAFMELFSTFFWDL